MATLTMAYAVFFECPSCGQQIDVGESMEALSSDALEAIARRTRGQTLEGVCHHCRQAVTVNVSELRSRARN